MSVSPAIACVVSIHAVPRSLLSRLDWAVSSVLGAEAVFGAQPNFSWLPLAGHTLHSLEGPNSREPMYSATLEFKTTPKKASQTASQMASEIARWQSIWFEVSVPHTAVDLGQRYAFTPLLGMFHAQLDAAGNQVFGENQIAAAMQDNTGELRAKLNLMLGLPWDAQLEPLRKATLEAQYLAELAS